MKKLLRPLVLLTVITITSLSHALAQNKADSLRTALANHQKEDTTKIHLLIMLAQEYFLSNADSQLYYAKQALALSEKLSFQKGMVNAYEELGSSRFLKGKYDSAVWYQRKGLETATANKLEREKAALYNNIANALLRQGKYTDALHTYDTALTIAESTGNKTMVAKIHSNSANIYYLKGNYKHALERYLMGMAIQEETGNTVALASDVSNIANVYMRLGNYSKALEFNAKGLDLNRKNNAYNYIVGNLTTYALIFDKLKQYDSSLLYLNEAMNIAAKTQNAFLQNVLKGNIAEVYMKKGNLDKAMQLYTESLAGAEGMQDAEGIAFAKAGIGEIMCMQGNTANGLIQLKEALAAMEQLGIKEQAKDISGKIAAIYEKSGDYKNALAYFKINDNYRDSLLKDNSNNETEQLLFNYEIEKKEKEILLLEKDKAIARAKSNTQNILLFASFIGVLLAGIIAALFFRNAQQERKRRTQILHQKEELQLQASKLQELNDFKDSTFSVLSHDLRSPVNALTGTMMMLDEKLMTPEEFSMHKNELNNKLQSVSLLLENMLYWAQSRMKGEHTLDIEKLNIKRKALRTMAVLKDAAAVKNITLTHNIPEGIYAYGDMNQMDIVLRNLVSNAIKFTPQNGTVSIHAFESGKTTQIAVTDTGVGMNSEQLSKLFKGYSHESTMGTDGEKGTGLGLQLSYEFVKKNGGDIIVTSTPGKGTTFTVSLPNTL